MFSATSTLTGLKIRSLASCSSVWNKDINTSVLSNWFDNVAEEILSVKPEHDVGRKCKMIAKKITAKHKSWGATKEAILLDLLTLKLQQHEPFRKALLATDGLLFHTVASDYWGLGRHREGANRCGELLMKLRQSVQSSWGAPHNQVLIYTDSIFKYLPTQIEKVGFCVKALPGASVGGMKNLTALIHQDLKPGYKPNIVILHVGTNDLAFLERYPLKKPASKASTPETSNHTKASKLPQNFRIIT